MNQLLRWFSLKRVVFWLVILYLLSYVWTYQRVQDAIATALVEHGIEEVEIGSLIIPYTAFFQTAYVADTGVTRSRKRARAEVFIRGHGWAGGDGIVAEIDAQALTKINKVTGKKFVFSYLTDIKTLRPVIDQYMSQLIRDQQIDKYEIETFDNRGPYIIVALHANNRDKDANTIAASLAKGLYINLNETNQLKANQVVVKVVDPEPYITNNTVTILGRGTAGNY